MAKYNFDDEDFELDDDLQEEFGTDLSSVVSKQIKGYSKNKKNKPMKFHKDGYYEKNRK